MARRSVPKCKTAGCQRWGFVKETGKCYECHMRQQAAAAK